MPPQDKWDTPHEGPVDTVGDTDVQNGGADSGDRSSAAQQSTTPQPADYNRPPQSPTNADAGGGSQSEVPYRGEKQIKVLVSLSGLTILYNLSLLYDSAFVVPLSISHTLIPATHDRHAQPAPYWSGLLHYVARNSSLSCPG